MAHPAREHDGPVSRARFLNRAILPRRVAAVMKREVRETGLHALPDGRRIAFRQVAGIHPAIVFLPGYQSDMAGNKAIALFEWAERNGHGCLLLDYSGCGESEGEFAEGTLTRWCDEVVALVEARLGGEVILVGSSMGGWLMLLAARRLGARVAALVGIAAAPDFTDWGFDDRQKAQLACGTTLRQNNPYGPEPTLVHPGFWADGEALHQLDRPVPFERTGQAAPWPGR